MARSTTEFVLTGPLKGKNFSPKSLPNVEFVDGVFVSDADFERVPHLARILEGYGAYPKSKIPEETKTKEKTKNVKTKKPQGKSSPKAGKPADKTPAAGTGPAPTASAPQGAKTDGKDGSGQTGAQTKTTDEDLI